MANGSQSGGSHGLDVRFRDDIPLQITDANTYDSSSQKKIGPLGRKRLRNRSSRRGSQYAFHSWEPTEGNHLSNGKGAQRVKMKRFGLGLSQKKKSTEECIAMSSSSSPQISVKPMFSFGRSKWSWTLGQREVNRLDKLDDNGLAELHIAAQNNHVTKIDDLIRKGADVNVKSSVDEATPLHMAARYNCPDATEILLQLGADVTDALTNGQTPLHVCCRRGYLKVTKSLVYNGKADINSRDKDKTTPLHQAAIKGDVHVCTYLVENGAKIRAMDINEVSPLMQAAQGGFKDCVQYLLSMAHQVGIPLDEYLSDRDNESNNALTLAVGNRNIAVARALIERGAPVNCRKTTNGFTPLHQAAIIGEEALVQMLIDKGAETEVTDNEQMTPLHRAALFNRVDTILLLIRQGLYLDSKDEDNFTPLLCAAWKGQTDAGRSLLRYGADIKAVDKEMKSCLHWAVEMQHVEFTRMLFEHGHGGEAIIEWKDRAEQTALHYAAEVGNVQILNLLIKTGADMMAKDGEEKSPLHIASQCGHVECVEALLQACPVPLNDDDIDDMTPLLLASQNGHHRVAKFLIKMGADINSRNDDRRSALALAAKNNEIEVLNVLIDNNANVNAIDKDQNTPLHLCAIAGHDAPTTFLLNNGADLRLQNMYGKYPLDAAIENKHESVANAILSCESWDTAMNNCDSTGHSPMRRLIEVFPEAALKVMDQCVTRSHEDANHPDLKVTYDYRYIDPGPDDISFDKNKKRYFALETMVGCGREKLLAHKLSQTSLSRKWNRFACYFSYCDLFFYMVFVVIVSLFLRLNIEIANKTDRDEFGCPVLNLTNMTQLEKIPWASRALFFPYSENGTIYGVFLWEDRAIGIQNFVILYVLFNVIFELIDMIRHRISYFKKVENYLHWMMYIPNFFFFITMAPCDFQWRWAPIAVFVTWMNFIFVLQRFDFFGLYVTMFLTTLKSLLKAMSVYIFFIIGFALAFFVCFQASTDSFRNEWQSIVSTFVMTLGEISKGELLDTGDSLHPFEEVANILVVIFLFLMPMVLINLTIGISVGDIEQILESSYLKRFSLKVNIIIRTEEAFPRCLQRKIWIPKADYWPNKGQTSVIQKVRTLLGGSSALRKSQDQPSRAISVQDIMVEVNRHEAMLSTVITMIQQQGELLRRIAKKHEIQAGQEDLAPTSRRGKGPTSN